MWLCRKLCWYRPLARLFFSSAASNDASPSSKIFSSYLLWRVGCRNYRTGRQISGYPFLRNNRYSTRGSDVNSDWLLEEETKKVKYEQVRRRRKNAFSSEEGRLKVDWYSELFWKNWNSIIYDLEYDAISKQERTSFIGAKIIGYL